MASIVCHTNGLGQSILDHAMLPTPRRVDHLVVRQKHTRLDIPTSTSTISLLLRLPNALLCLAHLVVDATLTTSAT